MANALLKEADLLKLELGSTDSPSVKRKSKGKLQNEIFLAGYAARRFKNVQIN